MIKPNDKKVERIVGDICASDIREERRRYLAEIVAPAFYATPVHKRIPFLHEAAIAMREAGLYSTRQPLTCQSLFSVLCGIHNLVRVPGDAWSWFKFRDRVGVQNDDIRHYFKGRDKRRTA